MDLSFDEAHQSFRAEVEAFLAASWSAERARDPAAVAAFRRLATEKGYLYRRFPKAYGGSEQAPDPLKGRIIRETFAKVRAPGELSKPGVNMLAPTLLAKGSVAQQDRFVARALTGEDLWCQGYSEPGAGSDLASVRSTGVLEGDEWVINGQKIWTSDAHNANYMFALLRTEPDAPKHQGLSYILLDMKQPGVTVRPLKQITGGRDFNEVFFDNARAPADWIVGARGEGWQVSRATLKYERDSIGGAEAAEKLFRKLVELAKTDRGLGLPIASPDVREALGVLEGYVLSQKYSSYRTLSMDAAGEDPGLIGLVTKLAGTEIGHRVSALAHQLIADEGLYMPDAPRDRGGGGEARGDSKWIYQFFGSLGVSIAGGTSNIQRNVIAERGLGLPREEAA
ncbi:MAG: acyl-CoA dehydrogenase [Brevundimonas sp.]|nr:acyl-CoA dehydrogenase [Brevundimonas sp.]